MLRPSEIDAVLDAARRRDRSASLRHREAAPTLVPRAAPSRGRGITVPEKGAARAVHSAQTSSGTGINPWWRYQESDAPGDGRVMVNVGTGNVLLQDDDMNVPHRGLALALRRTYNSQSLHDVAGTDGARAGMYGNGWTNTFDAHVSGDPAGGTLSVWDIDGARYDYTGSDAAGWTRPPGQHASLAFDNSCGYLWTKKSGTTYYFAKTAGHSATCSFAFAQYGGYDGMLYQIIGRNRNTVLTFSYAWDNGNFSPSGKISAMAVQAESGLTARLTFADVAGHRLLQQLTYPDGATSVSYGYDDAGNLTSVSRPPNNAAGIRPVQTFGYQAVGNGSVLYWAYSPRLNASNPMGSDGGFTAFLFTGTNHATATLTEIARRAVVNPTIADGSGQAVLQPGYDPNPYFYDYYALGVSTPTYRDTDGHAINWVVDAQSRPTQTQECTATSSGGCTGTWLVSNESWDADNNLAVAVDPRGNETDYLYDPMGNTTAVGEPAVTTSQGTFKPTELYDYDEFNNVLASCDATETHAMNGDWTPATTSIWPDDSLCGSHTGVVPHWRAIYAHPSSELYGELTSMTTPLGYTRTFSYAPGQQGGADYGLPTAVTGSTITQLDGSSITPAQTFWYDGAGNLRCYSKGVGMYVLSYDALGRLVSEADPDDSSANATSVCAKSAGQAGWNTQTTMAYFPDGSKQSTQTPSERAFGVSTAYTYDLDGNVITETQHHGCVPNQACPAGTTRKWYDGANRLVEVAQPHDARTLSNPAGNYDGDPWLTRYLYDLSGGGTVSLNGSTPFRAYGNLFKTQTLLSESGWSDVRGSAFDAADRETTKFAYSVSQGIGMSFGAHQLETTTLQYDLDSTSLGLLSKKTNPSAESAAYTYDAYGRIATESYAGDAGRTAAETYVYDPNGRKYSITSSQFGAQQYGYDADGRLTTSVEPSGGGLTSPAQITYAYYANGQRSAVSVASSGITQTNALTYSYRADGALRTHSVTAFSSGTWSNQYTDAGRLTTVSGADNQSHAYDVSGQLSTFTVSAGTVSYTHDPEGSVRTEYLPNVLLPGAGSPVAETITNTLNTRGELVDRGATGGGGTAHRRMTTNSGCTATSTIPDDLSQYDPSADSTLDPSFCDRINGVSLTPDTSVQSVQYNGSEYLSGTKNTEAFDPTGRLTQTVHTAYEFTTTGGAAGDKPLAAADPPPPDGLDTGGGPSGALTATKQTTSVRTYDAEDHFRATQTTINTRGSIVGGSVKTVNITGPVVSIGWGPNDHPVSIPYSRWSSSMGNMTAHWDGDMILFVTDGSGNVIDFKAGLDGDITPRDVAFTGLSVYDRDAAGVIVETANATGTTGFSPIDPSTVAGAGAGGTANYRGAVVQLQYVRNDGFIAAGVEIHGVRAYDPNVGVWTTPDAYEGDIHDPATQQRYVWNRGNAYDYSDPSGYKWDKSTLDSPASWLLNYMRAHSRFFNSIYGRLADSTRTYSINFAWGYAGLELGGFFSPPGAITLHPFGSFSNGADSDLDGMIDRLAHEIGHAYDYDLNGGKMSTGDVPPDDPHHATNKAEWIASKIHDTIMAELRNSGYTSGQFAGQRDFDLLRPWQEYNRSSHG